MKPLIRRSDLTDPPRWYVITRYREDPKTNTLIATTKYDVTDQIEAYFPAEAPPSERRPSAYTDPQDRWRLVRVGTEFLSQFGTRTERGERITAEWGEPDEQGVYEPMFSIVTEAPPSKQSGRDDMAVRLNIANRTAIEWASRLDIAKRLSTEWEAAAAQISERAMFGDPSAAIARSQALRGCADALRAALTEAPPSEDFGPQILTPEFQDKVDALYRSAAPPESSPAGLDVERLATAIDIVAVEVDGNEGILVSANNAEAIAAEYARLSFATPKDET